ncbi:MAG TPA: right-handed parallel beta-helix repeat-containing protein [Sedimentisphaerales bacterium]|nr:right-handed parallel beta-helix repeat-containing protein [Sedimentisphaerales bacterium]
MRTPHHFRSRYYSRLLLSLLVQLLLSCVCFGYGNLQFKDDHDNTVNNLWDERSYDSNSFPDGIPWLLNDWDPCSVIDANLAEFQAIVSDAFETWEAVPEANVAFAYAGLTSNGTTGNPADPHAQGLPPHPALDGNNVVVFDDTPEDALAITYIFTLSDEFTFDNNDADPNNDTDFIPEGTYPAGTILDADIVLNINESQWSVTGERRKYDVQGVLVHEIGHFIGLCHSCVRETYYSQATMFPFALTNPEGLELRTLSQDDIAGVSCYYPSGSFGANFGSIFGTVTKDISPFVGAHVWAVKADDRKVIVGAYSDESGNYSLGGLPPGDYILRVEPVCVSSNTWLSRINEILGAGTYAIADFQAEIYDEVSVESSATLVAVAGGSDLIGYDFTLLDGENPDPFEDDDTPAQARFLNLGTSREIHHIYPNNDVDFYRFNGTTGTTYRILVSNICVEQRYGVSNMNSDTAMTLYDEDSQAFIRVNNDLDTSNSRLESCIFFTAPRTATYYVKVSLFPIRNLGDDGVGRNYDFAIDEISPQHYHVDVSTGSDNTGNGSQAFPWATIQYAIDSVTGTVVTPAFIHVAEGTYYENLVCDSFKFILGGYQSGTWARNIETYETVLDGNSSGSVILAADMMDIEGFTITNGLAWKGGGILCPDGESACIVANKVANNTATGTAGGIGLYNGCDAFVSSNTIYQNVCSNTAGGGGMYVYNSHPHILRNTIFANTTQGSGAAIRLSTEYCESSVIKYNLFLANACTGNLQSGGALSMYGYDDKVVGNTFVGNTATDRGGAVCITYYPAFFSKNVFCQNNASNDGGALYSYRTASTVKDNIFVDNSAGSKGGAIRYAYHDSPHTLGNVIVGNSAPQAGGIYHDTHGGHILNNTIVQNDGGGICVDVRDKISTDNNIIAANTGYGLYEVDGSLDFQSNNILANSTGDYYDLDTNMSYNDANTINSEVVNPGCIVANNVDWFPGFKAAPGGMADSIVYDPNTYQSILTDDNALFKPNALATLTINPDTNQPLHFYIISNTETTITTWGDMNSVASPPCTYQVFDYHLTKDSRNIEAGMDVSEYVETDIDGDDRPLYSNFDIGADEVFPIAGDFEPDEDVDWADLAIFVEHWLRSRLDADLFPGQGDGFVDSFDWAIFAQAWKSTESSPNWNANCDIAPAGGDGVIDWNDLAVFVGQWLHAYCADLAPSGDGDGIVNMLDFAVFAEHWLAGL